MPIVETRIIESPRSKKLKNQKPVVINWKNSKLLRSQSPNNCVHEIWESSKSMQFVKVNLIGASSSGKTTLQNFLACSLHRLDDSFEVHFYEDEDLINFKATVENLSSRNQILCFDDLSGLVSKYGKAALDRLEAEITTVRHIGKSDKSRRIIVILSFHAQKKLSKFLRITNFTFYTDCQDEEKGYLEELLGKHQKSKIQRFVELRAQSRIYHKFSFQLSKNFTFEYQDGNPYRIILYNNAITTRFIVSPQMDWVLGDKICQICNPSERTEKTKKNLEEFFNGFTKSFGPSICKKAIQNILLRNGIDTQTKRVQQAEEHIRQFFDYKQINFEELADKFGLKERGFKTRLLPDKQPEFKKVRVTL